MSIIKAIVLSTFFIVLNVSGKETANPINAIQNANLHPQISAKASSFRFKRQLSIFTNIKLNKQYQSCTAPGDKKGHCRHIRFCPMEGSWLKTLRLVDYLCVIGNSVIGVCCPDDLIIGPPSAGSNIVPNLPSDGYENEGDENVKEEDTNIVGRGCGMKTLSHRIHAGSRQTEPKEWPWMVALLEGVDTLFCGGVLITDVHVLTAAHCTNSRKRENIKIRLGEYDFSQRYETRAADFLVSELIQHSDFDRTTYDNDIAIIKLNRRTTFNSYIWPICLPPPDLDFVNVSATVTGWGRQGYGTVNTSNVLMEVSLPVWTNDQCAKSFSQTITKNVLCAAGYDGGKDSCQGDSGGPLQYQLENGRWVNIGIVSWGIKCGVPGRPGVYTRVNKYLNWIVDNTFT
ncbi:uncharacterized protein CBL_14035 [Carabus blaptoides fortunei]